MEYRKEHNKNIYVLNDKPVEYAQNLPMIKTVTINQHIDLQVYDAIIFTSKNGVIHLDSLNTDWKHIPSYAISDKTAKEIAKFGGNVQFIGKKKHGDQFAIEMIQLLQDKKVAYVGAKKIVSNLLTILNENGICCDHIAVYETQCMKYKTKVDLPDHSIIIFSAPSTIKCFMENVKWKDSFQAISIGNTTKKYFPDYIQPILSDDTTLQSCVQKALSL